MMILWESEKEKMDAGKRGTFKYRKLIKYITDVITFIFSCIRYSFPVHYKNIWAYDFNYLS